MSKRYIVPYMDRPRVALDNTLSTIGNISSSISILILVGENDSLTPVEQGLLLQRKLIKVNHPDHTLFMYIDLGYVVFRKWITYTSVLHPTEPVTRYSPEFGNNDRYQHPYNRMKTYENIFPA